MHPKSAFTATTKPSMTTAISDVNKTRLNNALTVNMATLMASVLAAARKAETTAE